MAAPTSYRRLAARSIRGALILLGVSLRGLAAQEGCEFGEEGNDVLDQQTVPGSGTITYVTRPHFVCADGVQIWADSAVAYSADALSHLIGSVRYLDRSRELTSEEARYFSNVGRLQASGSVVVVDRADGSRVENGDLVYLRSTSSRAEESMTVTTGSDGLRPRATMPPPPPSDSSEVEQAERAPYTVVGDRIVFRGSSYFSSTGNVEIEQDSLFAFADSAEYEEVSDRLVLVGSARVESADFDLVGRTITLGTSGAGANEIRAVREAVLTGEDLTLTAPQIRLYTQDGTLERLVAVPLAADSGTAPDGADAIQPVALAEGFELTGDSLDLTTREEAVDRILAAGRARSVSHARDSLNVETLPELALTDWLEGDTIEVTLTPAEPDTTAADVEDHPTEREYEVERIVARVGARSLYRLLPEDSTARVGIDPPAVHYVVGEVITIHMSNGEVEEMEVVGQTRGVHLEPITRAPEITDSTSVPAGFQATPADTTGAAPTDASAPGRVPAPDPPELSRVPARQPGRRP